MEVIHFAEDLRVAITWNRSMNYGRVACSKEASAHMSASSGGCLHNRLTGI